MRIIYAYIYYYNYNYIYIYIYIGSERDRERHNGRKTERLLTNHTPVVFLLFIPIHFLKATAIATNTSATSTNPANTPADMMTSVVCVMTEPCLSVAPG